MLRRIATGALLTFGAATALWADGLTEADIKRLALEAIRENPQIVMEAVDILQAQEAEAAAATRAQTLTVQREMLEQDPNAPVVGNPDGDVTIVEFFDYNCPYCRQAADELQLLKAGDDGIRIVMREWPILSEGSVFAARAALAARNQGKYEEFHWALMRLNGRAEEASVLAAAKDTGLDLTRLQADMGAPEIEEHIQTSLNLAQLLGFSGTPSFVIGDELVPGFVKVDELEKLVTQARTAQN